VRRRILTDAAVRPGVASRDVRAVAVVFAGNLIARALGALYPIALARFLGKGDFALAIFYVNTGFFVGELVTTGFPLAMTQKIAATQERDQSESWVSAAFAGGLPLLAASVLGGAILALTAGASPALVAMVVLGLTVDAYYFGILRGFRAYGLLSGYRIGANLLQLVLVIAIGLAGRLSLWMAVAIYSLAYLGPLCVIELGAPRLRRMLPWRAHSIVRRIRELGRLALPALISGLAYGGIVGLDVYFVRALAPDSLAEYGAARTLVLPLLMVPYAISVVIVPSVAGASTARRRTVLLSAMALSTLAAAIAILGYVWLAAPIVHLLFPASYSGATALVKALAPAFGLVGIQSVLGQWWLGIGRPWPAAIALVLSAAVAIGSHAHFTAALGGMGAAMSIGISMVAGIGVLGTYTVRTLRREDQLPSAN
jgi:O-antigen/teichoic acid export membrane protein